MVGKVLNERYRIDCLVGSGGMADVYKAFDLKEQRVVAVKALKKEYCEDPQYLRRFTREAQAMLSLSHKNIVTMYDVGSDDNVHYLVLEYIDGCTLRDYMDKHGALKPNIAVKIACEVLDGLSHAHEIGLVHRDVKPQNVMISSKREIKLADFGIAKFADSSTRTYEGTEALGSVYYISPEQAKGESVDAQTDLYSIGIMLYEMLTGKPPFSGDNAVQIALKHINEEMTPPYRVSNQIPIALSDVVMKATAKNRDARYRYAADMKKDLLRALKHPRSRFVKTGQSSDSDNASADEKKVSFFKKHLSTIAIVACVTGVIGIFAAMLLLSLASDKRSGFKSIPNLVGKTLTEAESSAEYRGFEIEIIERRQNDGDEIVILEQTPAAQQKAREGTVIKVVVSDPVGTTVVPDLYGYSVDEARSILADYKLVLDEEFIDYQESDSPEGTVIGQLPAAGDTVMKEDSVRITVSKQHDTFMIPDLISVKDASAAVTLLIDEGFENYRIHIVTDEDLAEVGTSGDQGNSGSGEGSDGGEEDDAGGASGMYYPGDDRRQYENMQVIAQSPAAGTEVLYNTDLVDLYVYRSSRGDFKHDFSENLSLKAGDSFIVTIITDLGEIVIFETVCTEDIETIPFRGYYWHSGTYTCILYVNGVVNKELSREFLLEVQQNG